MIRKTTYYITEGLGTKREVERAIPQNEHVQVLSTSGYSSALSKALTLASQGRGRVYLVLDADGKGEEYRRDRTEFIEEYGATRQYGRDFRTIWSDRLEELGGKKASPKKKTQGKTQAKKKGSQTLRRKR